MGTIETTDHAKPGEISGLRACTATELVEEINNLDTEGGLEIDIENTFTEESDGRYIKQHFKKLLTPEGTLFLPAELITVIDPRPASMAIEIAVPGCPETDCYMGKSAQFSFSDKRTVRCEIGGRQHVFGEWITVWKPDRGEPFSLVR